MTIAEVNKRLVFEMIQLTGHFEDQEIYEIYIQRALVVGMEHFGPKMEEIIAFDLNGKEIDRFKSSYEAGRKLKVARGNIKAILDGKRHQTHGYIFIKSKDWKG